MTLITAMLLMVYKQVNEISGYKIAKIKFINELDNELLKQIIIESNGDPNIFMQNIKLSVSYNRDCKSKPAVQFWVFIICLTFIFYSRLFVYNLTFQLIFKIIYIKLFIGFARCGNHFQNAI